MVPQGLTQPQFFSLLGEIGIDPAGINACLRVGNTVAEKQGALDTFKERARKAFKQRLFKVHPDRNPDDPQAEERIKQLNAVHDRFDFVLNSLKVASHIRREVLHHVSHRPMWTPTASVTTTGATEVSIGWYTPPFGH